MTKITDTTIVLDHTTLQPYNDFIPVGREGLNESVSISIHSILAYLGEKSYIIDDNTKLQVYPGTEGYATLEIDSSVYYRFSKNSMLPGVNNTLTLGSSTKQIKDIYLGSKIIVGSDASGDIYYNDGSKFQRLGIGTENQTLRVISGLPSWEDEIQDEIQDSITFEFVIEDWLAMAGGFYLEFYHELNEDVISEIFDLFSNKILVDTVEVSSNIVRISVPYDYRFSGKIVIKK